MPHICAVKSADQRFADLISREFIQDLQYVFGLHGIDLDDLARMCDHGTVLGYIPEPVCYLFELLHQGVELSAARKAHIDLGMCFDPSGEFSRKILVGIEQCAVQI